MYPLALGRYLETLTFEVDTHAQTHINGVQDLQSEFNGFNQSAIQSILLKHVSYYEKKVYTVMVNNSININKTYNRLSTQIISHMLHLAIFSCSFTKKIDNVHIDVREK